MLAVAEHRGIHSELIPRIATAFCGGVAYSGGMCGAVSGGIMAISLSLGRSLPTDPREPCFESVRDFMARFSTRFGSLLCPVLTGVDLGTPEGYAAFWEKDQKKECANYVDEATRLVINIVEEKASQ